MDLPESLVAEINKAQLTGSVAAVLQLCTENTEHMKQLNKQIYPPASFYCVTSSNLLE